MRPRLLVFILCRREGGPKAFQERAPGKKKTEKNEQTAAASKPPSTSESAGIRPDDGILAGLNPEQLQAVRHGTGPLMIVAGPGTGKTRTIIGLMYRFLKAERFQRILFLVDRTALA